jgi:ComF family protein
VVCGKPSFLGFTHYECRRKTQINGVYSFFYYQPPLRQAIKNCKFRHNKEILNDILHTLTPPVLSPLWELKKMYPNLIASFVPQTNDVYKSRGFNQSYVIATYLSRALKIPLYDLFKKVSRTKHQSQLTREERKNNLGGAFRFTVGKSPKNILLVDDIITTATTVDTLAGLVKTTNPQNRLHAVSIMRAR